MVDPRMTTDRAKGFGFWVASAYSILVGGFAGWCGKEFWTWQNVWIVVLPPVVLALLIGVRWWWQTGSRALVVLNLLGGVVLAGMGLVLAVSMAAMTERWPWPGVRAAAGATLMTLVFFLVWAFYVPPGQATRPPETDDSQGRNAD